LNKKNNNKFITFTVNGTSYDVAVRASDTLLYVLREKLGLTGTKQGCESGECGVCTVFVDGKLINSCILLAVEADGSEILTIEGVSEGNNLNSIQEAFINAGAVQCGFCTPGMILATKDLLEENSRPEQPEILEALNGHICRCTGYKKIIDAVNLASESYAKKTKGLLVTKGVKFNVIQLCGKKHSFFDC